MLKYNFLCLNVLVFCRRLEQESLFRKLSSIPKLYQNHVGSPYKFYHHKPKAFTF